jgi:hypothetical protein
VILIRIQIIVSALLLTYYSSNGQESFLKSENELGNLRIYLVIGQSNMAGRAPMEGKDLDTLVNVYLYTGDSIKIWEPAANPLNKYSSIRKELSKQKTGPAYHFARLLQDACPPERIGLVVNCQGGTSIDLWMPGTKFFNEAVSRTRIALKYGKLEGIIWHQGESDVKNYKLYLPKISLLISALRKEFNAPDLPFVAGQLSEDKKPRIEFNKMIVNLPDLLKNTLVVSAKGLTTIDSTHFDTRSIRILGERYAEAMNELTKKCSDETIKKKIIYDKAN